MTTRLEDVLRERMRTEAGDFHLGPEFIADTLAQGERTLRRRRWAQVSTVAVAVATVLLGTAWIGRVAGGSLEESPPGIASRSGESPEAAPDQLTSPTAPRHQVGVLAWARDLPLGPPPTLPFDLRDTVFDGDTQVPIPADGGGVVGRVAGGGWLVLVEHEGGGEFWSEHGVLHPSGAFEQLPVPRDWKRTLYPDAVSPDGTRATYRGLVTDVRNREIVAHVPADASYIYGWSPLGIVYDVHGPSNSQMLWQPGSEPVRLSIPVGEVYDSNTRTTIRSGNCATVHDLAADGSATVLLQGCAADRPIAVSPDGTRVLLEAGDVADLSTGERLHGPVIPASVIHEGTFGWQPVWEDDDHYLFAVEGEFRRPWEGQISGQHTAIVVRCSVSQTTCEQAGPELRPDATDDVIFDFFR